MAKDDVTQEPATTTGKRLTDEQALKLVIYLSEELGIHPADVDRALRASGLQLDQGSDNYLIDYSSDDPNPRPAFIKGLVLGESLAFNPKSVKISSEMPGEDNPLLAEQIVGTPDAHLAKRKEQDTVPTDPNTVTEAEFADAWSVLQAQKEAIAQYETDLIQMAHTDGGMSWRAIGEVLGISGQSVYRRYDPRGSAYQKAANARYMATHKFVSIEDVEED